MSTHRNVLDGMPIGIQKDGKWVISFEEYVDGRAYFRDYLGEKVVLIVREERDGDTGEVVGYSLVPMLGTEATPCCR